MPEPPPVTTASLPSNQSTRWLPSVAVYGPQPHERRDGHVASLAAFAALMVWGKDSNSPMISLCYQQRKTGEAPAVAALAGVRPHARASNSRVARALGLDFELAGRGFR